MEITVGRLEHHFEWKQISGDEESLRRLITLPDVNRPGLELTGYFTDTGLSRINLLGQKEITYINKEMDEIRQREVFERLTGPKTPCIIITNGLPCPEILLEIAQRKNFPIFSTKTLTSELVVSLTNYLDVTLAKSTSVHGELVCIYGVGVLITGRSGMGKSEIVLELIKRGHQLVADDRVDMFNIHEKLIGKTSQLIEGFMEVRGIGIIDVKRMYGITSVAPQTEIEMEIELIPYDSHKDYDRIGMDNKDKTEYLDIELMKMSIPVSYGRPMATVIETAVTNYLLLRDGFDSALAFEKRVIEQIEKNQRFD